MGKASATILVRFFNDSLLVLASVFYHDFDLILKSLRIMEKSDLKALMSYSSFSKFEKNC